MVDINIHNRLRELGHLIGNTPLFAIDLTFKGEARRIYAKAENFNMTGSIKDRMALHILRKGYERGALAPNAPIVEATSGNTGIAFASIGRALSHPVTIFMPDWMSKERKDLIQSLGAAIRMVSHEEGGFVACIRLSEEFAASTAGCFLPRQFSNDDNIDAHIQTTGPEIWWQLRFQNIMPDAFIAGVGTGGTVMGVGRFLKQVRPAVKLYPLEPANSPTLSTGSKIGKHRIQGVSDEFIPPIVQLNQLDGIVSVDDGDAILMAQKLARELGLGVGISSGANFLGALMRHNELGPNAVVVTVFPDDNKKYLSTDLMQEQPVRNNFLSKDVELKGFCALKRACHTCCDPSECAEKISDIAMPPCPRRGKHCK
ncbi:PLP-dependent cysteine synthase family protein [Elusimicrobiota bacterium]